MFRNLIILINVIAFGFAIFIAVSESPHKGGEIFVLIIMFSYALLNFYFAINHFTGHGSSWLALYFQRKKLEEQSRINILKTEHDTYNKSFNQDK